jgi:hypothetical protein
MGDELNLDKETAPAAGNTQKAVPAIAAVLVRAVTGGMGKTFLAQAFADQHKDRFKFLPIYLGDTAPFDAGLQLLTNLGISTAEIDGAEALREKQRRVRAEIE